MLRKATNIILAITILLSSSGFVIQKHYCQEELQNVAVFIKAEPCHKKVSEETRSCSLTDSNYHKHNNGLKKKDCCSDKLEYIKSEQELQSQVPEIEIVNNPILLGLISLVLKIELPDESVALPHFLNYKPPLLVWNLPLSLQTFLC
ncbi:MAG: hypothetical protein R3B93_06300 [Bacteroidia bacterium]